jgi:hypothetical protein
MNRFRVLIQVETFLRATQAFKNLCFSPVWQKWEHTIFHLIGRTGLLVEKKKRFKKSVKAKLYE